MKLTAQINKSPKNTTNLDAFSSDALDFFTEKKQGHMGIWEYGPSLFSGDPAGGGEYWASLVHNPGQYYLTQSDINVIQWAAQQEKLKNILADVKTVIELGPGSSDAITKKTLPFLGACKGIEKYIAIDTTLEQAAEAAREIKNKMFISVGISDQNYMTESFGKFGRGKNAVVMWGSSLGNIEGTAGENAIPKLIAILKKFKSGLKSDDLLIICFDTENRQEKILGAYSEADLRLSILSTLYRLKRDGYITGQFDPRVWNHEPVYYSEVGQCAHTVYPLFEQNFNLAGETIRIPAWHRLIANNSYKFSAATVELACSKAGLKSAFCLQNGPVAMLIASV